MSIASELEGLAWSIPAPNDVTPKLIGIAVGIRSLISERERLLAQNIRLRQGIERAIQDSESGEGWGPDITVVKYLKEALDP